MSAELSPEEVAREDGPVFPVYDYALFRDTLRPADFGGDGAGLRRFAPLLPLRSWSGRTARPVGATPCRPLKLAGSRGRGELLWKDEGANPAGSVRDRAARLALHHARQLGRKVVVSPSRGDLGASLAQLSRAFAPDTVRVREAQAPAREAAGFGVVLSATGTSTTAGAIARRAGWYDRSPSRNPYPAEGYKTLAYELFVNDRVPDVLVFAGVDGELARGLLRGFHDLARMKWIERAPRLIEVRLNSPVPRDAPWLEGAAERAACSRRRLRRRLHLYLDRERSRTPEGRGRLRRVTVRPRQLGWAARAAGAAGRDPSMLPVLAALDSREEMLRNPGGTVVVGRGRGPSRRTGRPVTIEEAEDPAETVRRIRNALGHSPPRPSPPG